MEMYPSGEKRSIMFLGSLKCFDEKKQIKRTQVQGLLEVPQHNHELCPNCVPDTSSSDPNIGVCVCFSMQTRMQLSNISSIYCSSVSSGNETTS